MSYYHHPFFQVPQQYAYTPTNWTPPAGQPTSAPPSTGGGNAIQFGSLLPNQVEALQYSHPTPVYPYHPYAVQMMPPYGYPPQMPHPQTHGSQPQGVPNPREARGRYEGRGRGGRTSHPPRDRSTDQRGVESGGGGGGGHREPVPHHKPGREGNHGQPTTLSRAATPTSQQQQQQPSQPQAQQQQREGSTGQQQQQQQQPHHHSSQMPSGGYPSQSMPMSSQMLSASHYPPHATYYYPAMYPHHHGYPMQPPSEVPPTEQGPPYPAKNSTKLPFEHAPPPISYGSMHPVPQSESTEASPKPTPASSHSGKKRLSFVDPFTHSPITDCLYTSSFAQTDKSSTGQTDSERYTSSRPTSRPPSPSPKTDVDQIVREVFPIPDKDKPTNKLLVSKVQHTELKTGDSSTAKQAILRGQPKRDNKVVIMSQVTHGPGAHGSTTASRHPQSKPAEVRPHIDPIVGATFRREYVSNFSPFTPEEKTSVPSQPRRKEQLPNQTSEILKTVESVQRHQDEKRAEEKVVEAEETKETQQQPEATVPVDPVFVHGPVIIMAKTKKPVPPAEAQASVVPGSRVVADNGHTAEKNEVEEQQKQPQSHPVIPRASTPSPVADTASEERNKPEPEKEADMEEEDEEELAEEEEEEEIIECPVVESTEEKVRRIELAAIATREIPPAVQDTKPDTPSKNVYSPSMMQEFKEKNKEPLPNMDSGPWLEGSDVESPIQKDRLSRRNSSGKLGPRSGSYQGISRRNSFNNKTMRQSKSDPDEIFHRTSGNRVYTVDFLMRIKAQFTDRPAVAENLYCIKDAEGSGMRRSGSDRWSKPGRSAAEGGRSLSRSGSGREWQQKEGSRTGNVMVTRRLSRAFSGNRGADDSKWTPAPGLRTPEMELHHTKDRYIPGEMQTDDPEEELRQKTFKGVLNKLTPSNFARMYDKFKEVEIIDPKTLKGLIDQIFDKALTETTFCPLYSDLCKLLTNEVPEFEEEGDKRKLTFRRLLLNKCQNEFEKGDAAVRAAEEAEADSVMSAEERQARLLAAKKERMRSLGNMQFIGFLFKKGMLTERIIHNCIVDLLSEEENPKPEDIECLCQLLATVGSLLKSQETRLDAYFSRIQRLSAHQKLETRHRFMLIDLIELKDRKWVERHEKEGPKKIEEIHRDAQIEQMNQNARNRSSYGGFGGRNQRGTTNWSRTTSASTAASSRPVTTFNSVEEVKPLTKNLSLGRTASSDISLRPSNIGGATTAVVSMPRPRSRSPTRLPQTQSRIEETDSGDSKTPAIDSAVLTRKVASLLNEYHEVKDLDEAIRCVEELIADNAPKSEIVKSILLAALNIRKVSVDDRLKPISPLLKELLTRKVFSSQDTKKGLQITMAALPEVIDDFPKAPTLIARMLGSLVSDGIIPLKPILDPMNGIILGAGNDSLQSDGEDTPLVDAGIARQILRDLLQQMKIEEKTEGAVREALSKEDADLILFYPSCSRNEVDLSVDLQFLD